MSATVSYTGDTPASVTHVAGHLCYLCPRLLMVAMRLRPMLSRNYAGGIAEDALALLQARGDGTPASRRARIQKLAR